MREGTERKMSKMQIQFENTQVKYLKLQVKLKKLQVTYLKLQVKNVWCKKVAQPIQKVVLPVQSYFI